LLGYLYMILLINHCAYWPLMALRCGDSGAWFVVPALSVVVVEGFDVVASAEVAGETTVVVDVDVCAVC